MSTLHPDIKTARLQVILDALDADENPAGITIYSGTRPSPGGAITDQLTLATWTLQQPAGSITTATLTLALASVAVLAANSGTATWGRITDGAGLWVMDGDAGLAEDPGVLFVLDNTSILEGGLVGLIVAKISEP